MWTGTRVVWAVGSKKETRSGGPLGEEKRGLGFRV